MKSGPKASRSWVLKLQTWSGHPQGKNYLFPHPSIVRLSPSALSLFDKLKALSAKPKGSLPKGSRRVPSSLGEGKMKGSGFSLGHPRPTGGKRVGVRGLIFSGLILVLISLGFGWAGERAPLTAEQKEVASAAKRYLDAEVKQDYRAVFKSLYPGSDYCRANGFQAYRAEAQSSSVRIASYKILNIRLTSEYLEKEKYPNLEGFARVEVDVTIRYRDSGQKSLVNYDFPFVKEGGRWYKL